MTFLEILKLQNGTASDRTRKGRAFTAKTPVFNPDLRKGREVGGMLTDFDSAALTAQSW